MSKPKLYVGCALAHSSQEFKEFISSFKQKIAEETGIEVLEFLGQVKGTEAEVYKHDIEQVHSCDFFVAFVDYPSLGLGMELNEAITQNKKPLLFIKQGLVLSRMVKGAHDLGLVRLEQYTDLNHAMDISKEFINQTK